MLAIVAPSFDAPSETFIRDHVRTIAPGATILISLDRRGTDRLGCPVLAGIDAMRDAQSLGERAARALRRRWRRYFDPGLSRTHRRRVVAFLRAHRPRAVLAEYGPVGSLLASACREAGVPLYVHFHGFDASAYLRLGYQLRWYRALFETVAGVIAGSRFIADQLIAAGCPKAKLHVNPLGVDPARFAISRRLPYRIVAVGRLVEKKAPHLTIEAFGRIAGRYPDARLDMIGDGPLAERCRAVRRDLGLEGRVHLHGAQGSEAVAALMGEASLFVQHSVAAPNGDAEGFGISLVEAMASALPVVATRHNGFVETVQHGVTGLLVAEHDIDAMAAAMSDLLADPERAAAMGAAGRARVLESYSLDRSCERLRAIMGLATLAPGAAGGSRAGTAG